MNSLLFLLFLSVHGAVLDPALYLSPSPPLLPASDTVPPEKRWTLPVEVIADRDIDDIAVIGLEDPNPTQQLQQTDELAPSSEETATEHQAEPMEKAETIWPTLRSNYGASIHIPLTFSLSGTYGRYAVDNPSMVSNTYASTFGSFLGSYGKSALAGSGYGHSYGSVNPVNTGVRIYGSNPNPTWSGWGNGKWGHYGKG